MSRPDILLGDLAMRLAGELDAAAEACHEVQALAAELATTGGATVAQMAPLQSLDALTQKLSVLSLVLLRFSQQAGDHRLAAGPLLDNIGLSDLAKRLEAGASTPSHRPGEADLF